MAKALNVAHGIVILDKYTEDQYHVYAEHDIIYAGPDESVMIPSDEKQKLESLDWFIDSESGRWAVYV